jgi:hypothetical protein
MKKLLTVLFRLPHTFARRPNAPHDDSLRANQGSAPAAYSAWRALVMGHNGR